MLTTRCLRTYYAISDRRHMFVVTASVSLWSRGACSCLRRKTPAAPHRGIAGDARTRRARNRLASPRFFWKHGFLARWVRASRALPRCAAAELPPLRTKTFLTIRQGLHSRMYFLDIRGDCGMRYRESRLCVPKTCWLSQRFQTDPPVP